MKKSKKIILGTALLLIVTAGPGYSQAKEDFQNDGKNARLAHHTNILDHRYLELFIIGKDASGNVKGTCYNTVGLNGDKTTGNSAPQELVNKLDVAKIKMEYKAMGVFINGPRKWCLDWIDIPTGIIREFNGLQIAWVAALRGTPDKIPYKPMTIERKSAFGINKGTTVFILDDPEGQSWVMKSYSLVLDPSMTREKVPATLAKLKLPAGWKYRVKVLDKDLKLVPESGVATIVADDLDNVYDLTGPGYSNYKP